MALNWTCPHCSQNQTVTDARISENIIPMGLGDQVEGHLYLDSTIVGCANDECRKSSVYIRIGNRVANRTTAILDEDTIVFSQRLIPQGSAKPQPDYIPKPLRDDYYEACLIADLSPKASATLTRRCLQGMIRDFARISKPTLFQEITALKAAVAAGDADRAISEETVEAIDHVRGVGNIGAHMEKDINTIVDVDAGESATLIELVEMLFDEWYGARERRKRRLAKVAEIAADKKAQLSAESKIEALPAPDDPKETAEPSAVDTLLGFEDEAEAKGGRP